MKHNRQWRILAITHSIFWQEEPLFIVILIYVPNSESKMSGVIQVLQYRNWVNVIPNIFRYSKYVVIWILVLFTFLPLQYFCLIKEIPKTSKPKQQKVPKSS